ncbi:MAG: FGGY family carbohydrate kinase [Lachnospiraceae bacterium]
MNQYLIGFDIGTLSSKAVLTDLKGNIISKFQKEHAIEVKHAGWQEESMTMWWDEFKAAINKFLSLKDVSNESICAIGVTGLIPAMCPITKDGTEVRNAILHTDVRAEKELLDINEKLETSITHGHMLPKIMWVKENEAQNYKKIAKVMVPHGFIGFKLTGRETMDYDAASMVGGMFDEKTLSWKIDVAEKFGLDTSILPELNPANSVVGNVSMACAEETGLSVHTKVITGVGDTFASMVGGGAYSAKHFMIYLGTSATSMYAEESPENYVDSTHYGEGKGHFAGRIFSFGESILHLRNNLRYDNWEDMNYHLDEIEPGTEGLWYFPHYKLQTETSFFGPDAEFMLGYRGCHTQFDWYHAMLEGIAYNARYNVINFVMPIDQINIFGGGANSKEICQMFADIIGRELHYNEKSSTALGIAFLAGYGSGAIKSYSELENTWFGDTVIIKPNQEKVVKYNKLYAKYQELRTEIMRLDTSVEEV